MAYNSFQGIIKKFSFIISGILLFILFDQSSVIAQKEMFRYIQLPDPVEDSILDYSSFSDSSGVIEFSQESFQLADVSQMLWACWLPNKDLETKNPTGNFHSSTGNFHNVMSCTRNFRDVLRFQGCLSYRYKNPSLFIKIDLIF